MRERPILFSAPMVRAILDGRKTQTRRVAKLVRHPDFGYWMKPNVFVQENEQQHVIDRACPYGQPGDRLWVRETFFDTAPFKSAALFLGRATRYAYRADEEVIGCHKWKPSIHMPRRASRILLDVTAIRVERLQDISEADARAEGARECDPVSGREVLLAGPSQRGSFVLHYRDIWEQINGPDSWAANPWVWIIEFRRAQP